MDLNARNVKFGPLIVFFVVRVKSLVEGDDLRYSESKSEVIKRQRNRKNGVRRAGVPRKTYSPAGISGMKILCCPFVFLRRVVAHFLDLVS